jgi:hypothetical protein
VSFEELDRSMLVSDTWMQKMFIVFIKLNSYKTESVWRLTRTVSCCAEEVIINVAWRVNCNRHKGDRFWSINVQLAIMENLFPNHYLSTFMTPSGSGAPSERLVFVSCPFRFKSDLP